MRGRLVLAVGAVCLALAAFASAGQTRAPAQPIAFSHEIHAGKNAIGCTACHAYARSGPVAGIPSAARCYGCHRFVDKDREDVQAVVKAYTDGTPIRWNRVNRLPDHVFFTHDRHLANGVGCESCHGNVAAMTADEPVQRFTMGFCVDCHRAKGAPTDCLTCHK